MELLSLGEGVSGWFGGLGCNGTDGYKEGTVDCTSEIKEFSTNLLDEFFVFFGEGRGRGRCFGILLFASVFDGRMQEWLVFQFGMSVFENGKHFLDVSWHEQMDLVVGVISMHLNSSVTSP